MAMGADAGRGSGEAAELPPAAAATDEAVAGRDDGAATEGDTDAERRRGSGVAAADAG